MIRKFLFISIAVVCFSASAQVTLEHSYSIYRSEDISDDFYGLFKFATIEDKYVFSIESANGTDSVYHLYNLNHSLYKSVDIPTDPMDDSPELIVVSDKLFDTDDELEFMVQYMNDFDIGKIVIFNEDGSELLSVDSVDLYYDEYYPYLSHTFVNTDDGWKMILWGAYQSDRVLIYALPGNYIASAKPFNDNAPFLSEPSPNPSSNKTSIRYELPLGVNEGEIVVYNLNGQEQRRYRVDQSFNSLILDNSTLAPGTYFYQLIVSGNQSGARNMVVIK